MKQQNQWIMPRLFQISFQSLYFWFKTQILKPSSNEFGKEIIKNERKFSVRHNGRRDSTGTRAGTVQPPARQYSDQRGGGTAPPFVVCPVPKNQQDTVSQ